MIFPVFYCATQALKSGMDPLSALSVTSSIVTFVDFACKLVAGTRAIYQCADGLSTSRHTLGAISQDFQLVTGELRSAHDYQGTSNTPSNGDLTALLNECTSVADRLGAALDHLRAQGPHKRWGSFKAALREVLSKDAIEALLTQLSMLQSQLSLRLLTQLRSVAVPPGFCGSNAHVNAGPVSQLFKRHLRDSRIRIRRWRLGRILCF